MMTLIIKGIISGIIVSFCSWLSLNRTILAGFITSLPIVSLLALLFTHAEWKDPAVSVGYAKSIFFALPLTMLFFLPFLFAEKIKIGFWGMYISGLILLFVGYLIHSYIMK